jgi:RNase adapter protein RapZ
MKFVIVTGMSGAGKSTALKFLEDINFFCVDNLPVSLISKFFEICISSGTEIENVAVGIDIRGGKTFSNLVSEISKMGNMSYQPSILFLDSTDEVLLKRYKETRRSHPLSKNDRVIVGIQKERELLLEAKTKADYIIDTSFSLNRQLKEKIIDIFLKDIKFESLMITILSFGFKYGMPSDADLVFDVRFIPNPYYLPELRKLTGNDKEVQDYVLQWDEAKDFIPKLEDMLDFLIPNYIKEGKNQLVIAIGCTGGKHRSVTVSNKLYSLLHEKKHSVNIQHRDIHKDAKLL